VPIPALRAVKAYVDLVSGADKFVRKVGPATGAEDNPSLLEGGINLVVPPALVPELHNVAACWIELARDRIKAGFGVAKARRQLKEKAAHLLAENVGNDAKILDERLCALKPFHVRDELADLHRVNELHGPRLTFPGLNARHSRPGVEGRVDLNGVEKRYAQTIPAGARPRKTSPAISSTSSPNSQHRRAFSIAAVFLGPPLPF